VKRVTNLLHLLTGIALLAIGAYFFRGLARNGERVWQQQSSVVAQPPRSAKSGSASDDPLPGAANEKVYAVLGQQDAAAGGDNAVPAPSSGPDSLADHINHVAAGDRAIEAGAPNHFLHRRLSVKTFEFFEFEVPPQAIRPELEGTFQSVAALQNPDGGPSVEVLLMSDKEFARFVNHRPVTAMLSSRPSSGGEIYWKLKAPADNPQRYYLVFRNSSEEQGPSIVDADFTASFE
jgi:hypothetical protein